MTFRARPVAKRPSRSGWDSDERRTALINGGFILAIVAAIIILVGYAGWSYYTDHYGAAATVDGATITRDDVRTRIGIETFRTGYTEARVRNLLAQGRVTQDQASQELSYLDQQNQSIASIALERLIDATLQAKLAAESNVTVSDAEIDAQMQKEATLDEERHVWVIEVEPSVDPATGQVGDAQKAAAKAKAEAALADLKAGQKWEDVAKKVSTATSAEQAGDLGWLTQKSGYDTKLMDATFAVAQDAPTDVIEGDDGIFRIGRVTEIAAQTVDQGFQSKLDDAGVKLGDYRNAVKADVVQTKLSDQVVADLSKPSTQRHVLQIYLADTQAAAGSVKIRQIVVAPNHDTAGAANVPASDPAWAAAQSDANAIYQQLQLDPSKFDALARNESDDKTSRSQGGQVDWVDASTIQANIPSEVVTAVTAPGLHNGQILAPLKTPLGWYIVQFLHPFGDGNEAWLNQLKARADAGIDFALLARDNDEGTEAKDGGDIGWVVKGQIDPTKEAAIFATTVGQTSDVVTVQSDGVYLFKVLEEATRTPDAKQIKSFQDSGFANWYAQKKAAASITRIDTSGTAA